jgi:hypothetical protein
MTHVFFSFHYSHDYDRITRIMESFTSKTGNTCTPFITDDEIERMKREGLESILTWIETEVSKADAVVLLIGEHSYGRYFIDYEIAMAKKYNIPVIGIYIDQIPDRTGALGKRNSELWNDIQVYDWINDQGEINIDSWIEKKIERV